MSQISLELHHQISQFLYREGKALDDWKFRDWLDMLAEDISYTLRTTPNAQTRDRRRSVEPPTTWVFNDTKDLLERRVARLETGMAWAEEPPSRTTHMVSNVIVEPTEVDGEYDKLRQVEGGLGFQIFNRKITLDQVTYNSHNLSVFF